MVRARFPRLRMRNNCEPARLFNLNGMAPTIAELGINIRHNLLADRGFFSFWEPSFAPLPSPSVAVVVIQTKLYATSPAQ